MSKYFLLLVLLAWSMFILECLCLFGAWNFVLNIEIDFNVAFLYMMKWITILIVLFNLKTFLVYKTDIRGLYILYTGMTIFLVLMLLIMFYFFFTYTWLGNTSYNTMHLLYKFLQYGTVIIISLSTFALGILTTSLQDFVKKFFGK